MTHLSKLSNALGSSSGMWIGMSFFDQGSRSMASNTGYWHSTSMCAGNLQHSGSPTKNVTSLPASLLYKFFHLKRGNRIVLCRSLVDVLTNDDETSYLYLPWHALTIFNDITLFFYAFYDMKDKKFSPLIFFTLNPIRYESDIRRTIPWYIPFLRKIIRREIKKRNKAIWFLIIDHSYFEKKRQR